MNSVELEFTFDDTPWERLSRNLQPGGSLPADVLLSALEGEDEQALRSALDELRAKSVAVDLTRLPKYACEDSRALRLREEEQLVKANTGFSSLPENDPLRLFYAELEGALCSAPPETRALLAAVPPIAAEYVGMGVLLMDLIQEGSLAVWEAIAADAPPADYPAKIREALLLAVLAQARADGVGRRLLEAMRDYRAVDERLLSQLGRNATIEEIAEQMHLRPDEAARVADAIRAARLLERAVPAEEPERTREEEQAVEDTALFQMRSRIADLLSLLPPDDANMLSRRLGQAGGAPIAAPQAGKSRRLTTQEVASREAAALAVLRSKA